MGYDIIGECKQRQLLASPNHHNYEGVDMAEQDSTPTQKLLHQLFEYKGGKLYWKVDAAYNVKIGDVAGTTDSKGYKTTKINGKIYKVHRLIFLMHYGYLPKFVDHKDKNPSNNKIENLRDATHSENQLNSKIPKNNTSGIKGVSWNSLVKKWAVRLNGR